MRIADSLAYINHDIDDGVQVGIIKLEEIPRPLLDALGRTVGERVGRMVEDVIAETTRLNLDRIAMSATLLEPTEALRKYLFDNFYLTPMVNRETDKSKRIVTELYEYFLKNPEQMDVELFGLQSNDNLPQLVCDYLACMTDDMALETYIQVFVPRRIA